MRTLVRNKKPFYSSFYMGLTNVYDEQGYLTGEKRKAYSEPRKRYGNISPSSGYAQVEQFGSNVSYDKVIILDINDDCDINENSVLCIDVEPTYKNGELVYDYVVTKVARSLNHISIACKKVDIE